jgi:uncharacterized protein
MTTTQENQQQIFARLQISPKDLSDFCTKWGIQELALFGSVLRDNFSPDSDIDVMVAFAPEHNWGLEFMEMADELERYFQRKVDFVTRSSIENSQNWIRRQNILDIAEVIYTRQ